ncbi:hypothetical protein YC2023_093876 [Brassica napus]
MKLAWIFPFSLSVTAPLGFEDDPVMVLSATRRVSLPVAAHDLRRALFSPPVLHFSSLHRRNLSVILRCLSRILTSRGRLGSQEPNLPPALDRSVLHVRQSIVGSTMGFCCRESFGFGSAQRPPPLVSRSRCQSPPLKPLGATLGVP